MDRSTDRFVRLAAVALIGSLVTAPLAFGQDTPHPTLRTSGIGHDPGAVRDPATEKVALGLPEQGVISESTADLIFDVVAEPGPGFAKFLGALAGASPKEFGGPAAFEPLKLVSGV